MRAASRPFDTRVGAYGVIVQDGRILLAHEAATGVPAWTLPGGGLEAGENPSDAAVREIFEETGHHVRLERLLGIDSVHFPPEMRRPRGDRALHSLRILYRASVIGGRLRPERGGSTDEARWFPLDAVRTLKRVELVDAGIRLLRTAD